MRRREEPPRLSVREAFDALTVEPLKKLAAMFGAKLTRKGELVDFLTGLMTAAKQVRALYEELPDIDQKAVQEATHAADGAYYSDQFYAKYGNDPDFGDSDDYGYYSRRRKLTKLELFFPGYVTILPLDLQVILRTFVPPPPPLRVEVVAELPATVKLPYVDLGEYHGKPEDAEEVEPQLRLTAHAAEQNVKAVLRLLESDKVKVSDKTRRPTAASATAVLAVLAEGDFYGAQERSTDKFEQVVDLEMQPFAWPLLVQAGGLAESAGGRLQLTAAGRKALTKPAHEVLRQLWEKWQKTTLLDEFQRINLIKGQQSKGAGLSAVAGRRQAIAEALTACPAGQWLAIDELFRVLKVLARDFVVAHDPWRLYLFEQQYGSFGDSGPEQWEMLQGRYVLALLFEYAATLGLLDVAYTAPYSARNDFSGHWGADDLSCLSRYDGLLYVRINALGAWCLGIAAKYTPAAVVAERLLKVLPNHDLVATERPLGAADRLFLDRYAERTSDAVWRLDRDKILDAVEHGATVQELQEFLQAKSLAELPQTVAVFLADLADKASQLADAGTARLIACRDATVAQLLVHDRKLRSLCQLAGDRQLVYRSVDEAAVRRKLRELGYVLPPAKE